MGTSYTDNDNEDYQFLSVRIDFRKNSYSGSITQPNNSFSAAENFSWRDVPLDEAEQDDPTLRSGKATGVANMRLSRNGNNIELVATHSLLKRMQHLISVKNAFIFQPVLGCHN